MATVSNPQAKPTHSKSQSKPKPDRSSAKMTLPGGWVRDMVEQLVFAILMALIIRFVIVEPFVIPTGSMAPTLMGRHKEVTCLQCGCTYQVNVSQGTAIGGSVTVTGVCPNCRLPAVLLDQPDHSGDRILVFKPAYSLPQSWTALTGPRRWDVTVFKYPLNAQENYIKRLVGMPGEEIKIYRGDLYTRPTSSSEPFRIAAKTLDQQKGIGILVNDDRYRPSALEGRSSWRRWSYETGWSEPEPGQYQVDSLDGDSDPLVYQNKIINPSEWLRILQSRSSPGLSPPPTLITDFYAYNSGLQIPFQQVVQLGNQVTRLVAPRENPHWVGDLSITGEVILEELGPDARLMIELVEGGAIHRLSVDLNSGEASVDRDGVELGEPTTTSLGGSGSHRFFLSNFDNRIGVEIDGQAIFADGLDYQVKDDAIFAQSAPTAEDLRPVRFRVSDAKLSVTNLRIHRDIYYLKDARGSDYRGLWDPPLSPEQLDRFHREFFSEPDQFALIAKLQPSLQTYQLDDDSYLMLGDNSPQSSDSRMWRSRNFGKPYRSWEVPEAMVVGQASLIWWPHAVNLPVPLLDRLAIFPYLSRMGWIW